MAGSLENKLGQDPEKPSNDFVIILIKEMSNLNAMVPEGKVMVPTSHP